MKPRTIHKLAPGFVWAHANGTTDGPIWGSKYVVENMYMQRGVQPGELLSISTVSQESLA
jgi:hypothetical protein